jgi:3-oxoacyl-[acyl-carrier protein] reductase
MTSTRDPALPDLTGMTVLVTGASGNIGAGIATRFAEAGAAVVVHHHRGVAQALVAKITAAGGAATAIAADLSDDTACRELVHAAAAWTGRLDVLVNNAGVQPVDPLPGMTVETWRMVVGVNLDSVFSCTQAAAEVMTDGGSITHIASIEASQPAAGHAHYSSAKAAIVMHARAAALEYGSRGIRVNAVSPGLIDRPGLAADWPEGVDRWGRAAPLARLGTPADVANACVFLASPLASWVTGHNLVVDGGVSARPTW